MLQSCLECLFGNTNQQVDNEINEVEHNKEHINGNHLRAPRWPVPQNEGEIMFILPKQLSSEDGIIISGKMKTDRNRLVVSLMMGYNEPDYMNIPFQFEAVFPTEQSEDKITIKRVKRGQADVIPVDNTDTATDMFRDENFAFELNLRVTNDAHILYISIDSAPYDKVMLDQDLGNVRFLAIQGDAVEKINKLEFQFGA